MITSNFSNRNSSWQKLYIELTFQKGSSCKDGSTQTMLRWQHQGRLSVNTSHIAYLPYLSDMRANELKNYFTTVNA